MARPTHWLFYNFREIGAVEAASGSAEGAVTHPQQQAQTRLCICRGPLLHASNKGGPDVGVRTQHLMQLCQTHETKVNTVVFFRGSV